MQFAELPNLFNQGQRTMSFKDQGYTISGRTRSPRVVVTGLGVVSSLGIGRELFWDRLMTGCSGIGPVSSFDTSDFPVHQGAEVKGFEPTQYVLKLSSTEIGRASQFAIAAARLAIRDANLPITEDEADDFGVAIGTTSGEPRVIEHFDDHFVASRLERVDAKFVATYPCHVLAAHVACELDLAGEAVTIPTACAAGNHAIARACDDLSSGNAKVMLAGGADAFSRITYAGFARLGAIAPDVCQPFDRYRKGMIPGEGAAFLVLEELEHAQKRSARIYSEIAGYGLSCDAYHMTAADPQGDGAVRAMRCALASSGLSEDDVDYISAHGTGTPTNDRLETIAIKSVFGSRAAQIPVSGIKSMLGHAMGAASAIEAVACALAITEGSIPPTINLYNPDPQCDLDYVPLTGRKHNVSVALNNAYAFGGNNSSVVLTRYEA
jgi:3-oxoacyl-[acyl-carrier-protein] synthase II